MRKRRMQITGRQANLLLFALDKYLGVDEQGNLLSTDDHFTQKDVQKLRDRLFSIHEHNDRDLIEVATIHV